MNDTSPLDAPLILDELRSKKFFSLNAISIATMLGGPIAAGVMLRSNYVQYGQIQRANIALLTGVVATVLLLIAVFSLPEAIIVRIPNYVASVSYTIIIYLLANYLQGDRLNQHAAQKGAFHSGWRIFGVILVSVIVAIICIGCVALLMGDLVGAEF